MSTSLCVIASPLVVFIVDISVWQDAANNWLLITEFCVAICCIKMLLSDYILRNRAVILKCTYCIAHSSLN